MLELKDDFVLYHGSYCEVKEPYVQREKVLGVTLSQFFQEGNSENLTEKTEKSSRDMERSEYK